MAKKLEAYTKEELIEAVRHFKKHRQLGLVWEPKPEDVVDQCRKELPVLEEVARLAINTKKDAPVNLIVEGDNYHALSVLNYTHRGKVDLIYIDPPYNTGNQSWRYNNNYVEADDRFRHSKWLSFMKSRLLLSRPLLKRDGLIVVTIDDYEVFHLGLLMDECFGEKNRVATLVVENNPRGRTTNKHYATSHEYYLVYAKNIDHARVLHKPLTEEQEALFRHEDETGRYRLLPFRRSGGLSTPDVRPNSCYAIYYREADGKIDIESFPGAVKIMPVDSQGKMRVWRQTRPSLMAAVGQGDIVVDRVGSNYRVLMKDRIKYGRKPKTVWIDPRYDASSNGTVLLQKMLGKAGLFDYPKSVYAVLDFLQTTVSDKKDATVLDFFAGSGTTGHAVMMLNHMDEGSRKYILCTNNENKIAEEVTYPRIKKVISGYKSTKGIPANARYFKTAMIPKLNVSDDTRYQLVQRSADMIRVRDESYEGVVNKPSYKVFKGADHYTAILFDTDEIQPLKEDLSRLSDLPKVNLYVFSLTNDAYEEDFADLPQAYKLCPIPESILEAYRRIFKEDSWS